MSRRYKGGVISATAPTTSTSSATGVWTNPQNMQASAAGTWPRIPGAPTIGTATVASGTSASITFTAPTDLGAGTVTYTATSSPGSITGTSSASPVTVSGLTTGTAYTFTVRAATPGGSGPASAASNSVTPIAIGSQIYTAGAPGGTFTWVAPAGVTSVSVVAVGGRGCGASCANGGSGLGYKNNYAVTPLNSYTVQAAGYSNGGTSFFVSACLVAGLPNSGGSGGGYVGDGGGNGGGCAFRAGGGAGGYSGSGGNGASSSGSPTPGSSGSGGGGGGGGNAGCLGTSAGAGGGGVGLYGQGSNGAGGTGANPAGGGGGGSGGSAGTSGQLSPVYCGCCVYYVGYGGSGGLYGGGRGRGSFAGQNGYGAVRIVWPGNTRTFPSTCVGAP